MKLKTAEKVMLLGLIALVNSCAHHRDVRPGVEGIHKVQVKADDQEEGTREAVSQAQHYCEEKGKEAAFVKEESKYTGDMDEDTYKMAKKASKIAKVVGGTTWSMGQRRRAQKAGGIAGLGGTAVDIAAGEGYTVEMRFKCL